LILLSVFGHVYPTRSGSHPSDIHSLNHIAVVASQQWNMPAKRYL